MHIEKNICASLFKTFSNCKGSKSDSLKLRRSLQEFNVLQRFHPQEDGVDDKDTRKWKYTPPNWIWTTQEYDSIIDLISATKTPFGYESSFRHKFNKRKVMGFKTHDYLNLLYDLRPIAVRGTLTEEIRSIVYHLAALFCWICSKEIRITDCQKMKIEAAEILCEMEMHLPISIFDI